MMKRLAFICCLVLLAVPALRAAGKAKPVVSILGDSYSTFEGYIPAGNASWYATVPWENRTDVVNVRQTWNDSYSGATISYTGYNGEDYSDRSFLTRLPHLGSPDLLLIFGGTNDSWTGGPLGEYVYDNFTRGHLYEFRPALAKLLTEAQNRYPGTRIVFIVNTELKDEITESIVEICTHLDVEYVMLRDIDKLAGHPSIKGMEQIKNQILQYLKK